MQVFEMSELESQRQQAEKGYLEFLRVPSTSAGVYFLAKGGADPQKPHREDEIYYVIKGRGVIRLGSEDRRVQAGSLIFVPAQAEHRFHSIEEDLTLLVIFAPAETS